MKPAYFSKWCCDIQEGHKYIKSVCSNIDEFYAVLYLKQFKQELEFITNYGNKIIAYFGVR